MEANGELIYEFKADVPQVILSDELIGLLGTLILTYRAGKYYGKQKHCSPANAAIGCRAALSDLVKELRGMKMRGR